MGCSPSKPLLSPAGNPLVDGFLQHTSGTQGWNRAKALSGRKDLHLEVFAVDEGHEVWRGNVFIENAGMEDVLAYIKYKLGPDNFELLESDEDEWIFRELFDFKDAVEGTLATKHVGDHRGEMAERMEGGVVAVLDPRKTGLSISEDRKSSYVGLSNSPKRGQRSPSEMLAIEEAEEKEFVNLDEESDVDDYSSDEGDDGGKIVRLSDRKLTDGEDKEREVSGLLVDQAINQHSGRPSTWQSRLFGSSNKSNLIKTNSKKKNEIIEYPAPREMIFKRQDFGLGSTRAVVIASSVKYTKIKNTIGAKRCTVSMMGALVEEFIERKKPRTKLTFLCSLNPDLVDWEKPLASEAALSLLCGKARVESFLVKALNFFEQPNNRLIQRFRITAGAGTGELGWMDVERSKNELQLGTHVQHPTHGHGIVQSFDMKGRVRVVYDNKDIVDHDPDEKDDLRVAVIIGTRVQHPERGFGTVKAFDEQGRIHVKFDNGEMHRYKQEAWKKKMHTVKLVGIGGALGTVRLSWRPFEGVREGMGRVKFAVGVTTEAVLKYILESNSSQSEEDEKGGTVIERRVVKVINDFERIIYEHRKMPPPLTPRDFVFKEIYQEVAPKTFVAVYETTTHPDCPEKPHCVRGEMNLSGWLLEPLYLDEATYDDEDHITRVTFQMCIDAKGFIAPEAVEAVRNAQLLGAYTDCRAYFYQQSVLKAKKKLKARQSKRMSTLGTMESEKNMKKNQSKLKMI